MKRSSIGILILVLLGSCYFIDFGVPEPDPIFYTEYTPIMLTRAQLESAVRWETKREINVPAKIYTKDHLIFISEQYEGIHVIDNRNRYSPVNTGFIRIPGCVDMAMKENILYADNATDLIALDLSDMQNIRVVKRIKNTFPELSPPDAGVLPDDYRNRSENLIIVGWEK